MEPDKSQHQFSHYSYPKVWGIRGSLTLTVLMVEKSPGTVNNEQKRLESMLIKH